MAQQLKMLAAKPDYLHSICEKSQEGENLQAVLCPTLACSGMEASPTEIHTHAGIHTKTAESPNSKDIRISFLKGQGIPRKRAWSDVRAEDGKKKQNMLQSGHVMVIATMNSLQLCSPTQDMHQVKPVSIPAGLEEGLTSFILQLLLAIDSFQKKRSHLVQVWLQVNCSCSCGWPHTHKNAFSINWTQ